MRALLPCDVLARPPVVAIERTGMIRSEIHETVRAYAYHRLRTGRCRNLYARGWKSEGRSRVGRADGKIVTEPRVEEQGRGRGIGIIDRHCLHVGSITVAVEREDVRFCGGQVGGLIIIRIKISCA